MTRPISGRHARQAISFLYDGDGNRLRSTAGTSVTHYLWDTNGELPQLALERNANNALLRRYTYGNELLAESTPSATYYLTADQLGSVTGVTSATGTGLLRYSYEPFGKTRTTTKLVSTGYPSTQPMQFNGQYIDTFGLYNLRAREYDPTTGRFTSPDPVSASIEDSYVATYVYVGNLPTRLTDPTGESWKDMILKGLEHVAAPLINNQITSRLLPSESNECGWLGDWVTPLIPGVMGEIVGIRCNPVRGVTDAEEQALREKYSPGIKTRK